MQRPLTALFRTGRPLIGMVHLRPLPGAPRWRRTAGGPLAAILEQALADAAILEGAGFDGLMVENYGDAPFYPGTVPPETLAAMAVCVREVARATRLPVGVNLLRNDAAGALSVAHAAGARFIRVNVHSGLMFADQGVLAGQAHETLRLRQRLGAEVAIFADVWVKHASPLPGADLLQAAEDTFHRGLADALVLSGSGTGKPVEPGRVRAVRKALPEAPLLIGSGVTPETATALLAAADGAIVGSAVQRAGRAGAGVDPDRAAAFVASMGGSRE